MGPILWPTVATAGGSGVGVAWTAHASGDPDVIVVVAVCGLIATLISAFTTIEVTLRRTEAERRRAESEAKSRACNDQLLEDVVRGRTPEPSTARTEMARVLTGTRDEPGAPKSASDTPEMVEPPVPRVGSTPSTVSVN